MQRLVLDFLIVIGAAAVLSAQSPAPPRRASGLIAATAQNAALLRDWDTTITRMARGGDLIRRKVISDTLLEGRDHERYDQYVDGVRVVGGDVARQMKNGSTESIFGRLYAVTGVQAQPKISEDDARAIFGRLSGREVPPARRLELVILPTDDGRYVLAYETHIRADGGWMRTYVDARDGEVVLQYNDRQTQSAVGTGTGVLGDTKKISARALTGRYVADDELRPPTLITYDLQGNRLRTDLYLDGFYTAGTSDIASDTDNKWTDAANVDGHVHLGWTYDYYFKRFGRRGLDDDNTPIFAITHPVTRTAALTVPPDIFFVYVINAFWCGGCGPEGLGAIVFGDGLPPGFTVARQSYDFLAGGLDVVAHELTHGLTDYSSQLIYRNESGALNESFSDILGTSVEFFYQNPGSALRQADYLIGEDVIRPGGIRSMSDPGAFGDPDHYSRRETGEEDNGGVHHNSGISNQAFYLAIEGGVNRTSGLRVDGVGAANREQIEKVFYRAFVLMMPSNATFSTARAATIKAATDLYGAGSPAERAVTGAWTAVGVQ
jgi:bacillolysin